MECGRWMRVAGLVLCGAAAAGRAVGAQDPPARFDQTVMVTPAASPVSFQTLTRQVHVIGSEEIARLPARTVADVLAHALSLDVRARGPLGVQADFSLRGAGFGQVLVLVDGVRINDAQTGHHNSDIPVPLADIERIEVFYGAGSALYGADAVGGTINIITRSAGRLTRASVGLGAFGLVTSEAAIGRGEGRIHQSFAVSAARSSGFMYDREFGTLTLSAQTRIGTRTRLLAAHARKAFGANGFYGPSPSKEWTDQTLTAVTRTLVERGGWQVTAVGSYRTHGDRFLWDVRQPGVSDHTHRTHTTIGTVKARRIISSHTTVTIGGEAAGEWLRSTALGDRQVGRASLFGEIQRTFGARVSLASGLRHDRYSTFGSAWSPSVSASVWVGPQTRLRGSLGRTFRVPSFTERFYRDPAHAGDPSLQPEAGWEAEIGGDRFGPHDWVTTASIFRRQESGLIDWTRATDQDVWRTANLGSVTTRGVEVGTRGPVRGGLVSGVQYAFLDLDPGVTSTLLKYTQDYRRHALAVSALAALPRAVNLSQRLGCAWRVDGRRAIVWDARLAQRVGSVEVYIEATNLLDQAYQETRGVDMPGRWIKAGVTWDLKGR